MMSIVGCIASMQPVVEFDTAPAFLLNRLST